MGWLGAASKDVAENLTSAELTESEQSIVAKLLNRISSGIKAIATTVTEQIGSAIQSCVTSEMRTLKIFFLQETEKLKKEID